MDNKIIIPPPSYSFVWMNLFTLALFYAKIEVDLYISWRNVIMPSLLFCIYKVFSSLKEISDLQSNA